MTAVDQVSKFYTGIDVVRATERGDIVNIEQLRAALLASEADKIVALWNRKIKSPGRRNTIHTSGIQGKVNVCKQEKPSDANILSGPQL